MKKILIGISVLLIAMVLSGCSDGSVDVIKKEPVEGTKGITFGEMFRKWDTCNKRNWKTVSESKNEAKVRFICDTDMKEYTHASFLLEGKNMDIPDKKVKKMVISFDFEVKDKKFSSLFRTYSDFTWEDGTVFHMEDDPSRLLDQAYTNTHMYDPARLAVKNIDKIELSNAAKMREGVLAMYSLGHDEEYLDAMGYNNEKGEYEK